MLSLQALGVRVGVLQIQPQCWEMELESLRGGGEGEGGRWLLLWGLPT